MDRIETLRAFVLVVDSGSFSAAAARLGTSPQVVSKYVRALEAELDQQLLYRTTRALSLTEAGRVHLPRCRQLVEDFDELRASARAEDRTPRGHLVLTAPVTFGERVLAGVVQRFVAAHPGLTVEMRLTDQRLALADAGIDLAVRIGASEDAALIVRRLGPVPLVCCVAPAYLARAGRPQVPADLAGHDCILDSNFPDPGVWRFAAGEAVRVRGTITVNSAEAAGRLAQAGAGVAYAPAYVVAEALAEGRLEPLLSAAAGADLGLHVAYLPSRHLAAKVRRFIDVLAAEWQAGTGAA